MKRMQLLDYGRFAAAISVVAFHYIFGGIHSGKITSISYMPEAVDIVKYGYLGVEFFFMISGYVIFYSATRRSPADFAVSRAVRLYPAFWVAVIFTSLCSVFWGGSLMSVEVTQVILNLSMLAPYMGVAAVDGVYWTLLYEIQFYALVFILLSLGLRDKLVLLFLLWPMLMLIALYFNHDNIVYLGGYYSYFSAGAVFAILKNQRSYYVYASLITSAALCIMFSTGKVPYLIESRGVNYSEYIIGFIVLCFFTFFYFSNSKYASNINLYGSRVLGGLTYPVYLIHAHFGYMVISRYANEDNKFLIYFITITVVLSVSYFIYAVIEGKFHLLWKSLFDNAIGKPVNLFLLKFPILSLAYDKSSNTTN